MIEMMRHESEVRGGEGKSYSVLLSTVLGSYDTYMVANMVAQEGSPLKTTLHLIKPPIIYYFIFKPGTWKAEKEGRKGGIHS